MQETTARSRSIRKILLVTGTILWLLVIVTLYALWTMRSSRDPVSRMPAGEPLVLESDNGPSDPASGETHDASDPATLAASSESATSSPNPAEPFWDPDGVADFALTERSGRTVTKSDLLGRPWAVCFIFTQCAGPCPRVSAQMKMLQDQLKDTDVHFVSITVDPENDTPEKLRQYADAFGADEGKWWFLTGEQEPIYRLIGGSFKMPVFEVPQEDRKPGFQVIHSTNILHVNRQGVVVGKYDARKDTDMVKLRKALEAEAAPADSPSSRQPDEQKVE